MASNVLPPDFAGRESSTPVEQRRARIIRAPSLSLRGLLENLLLIVQYRDLLYTLSVHRIKVRYKLSVLGVS